MRIMQVISRTPCKQPSKRCAWCCYHGGHATMLSRQMNICVRGTSASILALTCVSHHRVSLRQFVSHAPQPISTGLKQPISAQFTFEPFAAQFGSKPFGDSRLVFERERKPIFQLAHFRAQLSSQLLRVRTQSAIALHLWEKKERSHRISRVIYRIGLDRPFSIYQCARKRIPDHTQVISRILSQNYRKWRQQRGSHLTILQSLAQ